MCINCQKHKPEPDQQQADQTEAEERRSRSWQLLRQRFTVLDGLRKPKWWRRRARNIHTQEAKGRHAATSQHKRPKATEASPTPHIRNPQSAQLHHPEHPQPQLQPPHASPCCNAVVNARQRSNQRRQTHNATEGCLSNTNGEQTIWHDPAKQRHAAHSPSYAGVPGLRSSSRGERSESLP